MLQYMWIISSHMQREGQIDRERRGEERKRERGCAPTNEMDNCDANAVYSGTPCMTKGAAHLSDLHQSHVLRCDHLYIALGYCFSN